MTAPAGASSTPLLQHAPTAKTLNALLHMPDAPMEMSQIGLIYRAEGNANLVLALPQFKKVLRLPKMISSRQQQQQPAAGAGQPEGQPSISDPTTKASSAKAGVLTMPDFMAYIEIMRRLLGNEFVCAADIVAIPKESDRFWINEHIRVHRPVARLDKEFVGPFGLLLPDVTQLPATFDVLLANLQAKDMNMDADADMEDISNSRITRLGDTYAIEIKPKQGWLQLPSDVSDLFDLMPAGVGTKDNTTTTELTYDPASKVRPMGQPLLLTPNRCWCRYCCMQHVKLHIGKIKRLGDYCPMQLFSGTPCRMLDALNALFACPQNNLRVFQSGNLIYGDHANSISCEELHSRVFPGEIMVLIKHLLVACLLREYSSSSNSKELAEEVKIQSQRRRRSESHSHVANVAFGESPCEPFAGLETKETTEIGVANVDVAAAAWHVEKLKQVQQEEADDTGIVEFVKAVDGQPQRRRYTRAADAEKATPSNTKRKKIAATSTATTSSMSTNVAIAAARTEATTETETMATAMATAMASSSSTQAQINNAEIFHLPNNCVLQKILHLQLLVKRHFHYMWQHGYAQHETPSYQALRALLNSSSQTLNVEELPPEQAYMLGATALDCSIMLTFQEIRCPDKHNSSLEPWLVCVKDRQFLTKLSILDLDPKPDSHYHKFIKHSREIEKCCRALN